MSAGNKNWGVWQNGDEDPPNQNTARDSNRPASHFCKSMTDHPELDPIFKGGSMARGQNVSSTSAQKVFPSNVFIIVFEESHHFICNKRLFVKYRRFAAASVQLATEESLVVGQGKVRFLIDKEILVDAFHTPSFSTNITSVAQLSRVFDLTFTYGNLKGEN